MIIKQKKDSKKFISFAIRCEWLCNGLCTALPEKSDCYQKKCKLFKSKYHSLYFGMTRQEFDSDEELEFYCWLNEANQHGLIDVIGYAPITFKLSGKVSIPYEKQLKTKIKVCHKHLFAKHSYSPDFGFDVIDERLYQYFINSVYMDKKTILVDIKGTFSIDSDAKAFSINQKWTFKIYNEYVEKVVIGVVKGKKGKPDNKGFFGKTWVPEIARLSPVLKTPVKKYIGVPTINEFMEV